MSWLPIALIAPLIWSLINHTDKYLVSKYFKGQGVGALMIFVGIISLPLAAAIWYLYPAVFGIGLKPAIVLILSGVFYNAAVLLYLYALEEEDASLVTPFWQLSPVFAYFFGIWFLGEALTSSQFVGSVVTLLGAAILSIEFGEDSSVKLKKRAALLMIVSSVFIALENVIFKQAAIDDSMFWTGIFWNQIGMMLFGIGCFCYGAYRRSFFKTLQDNHMAVTSLNILEQVGETVGVISNYFAVLLAPVALVTLLTYSAQPLFVFLFGIILTILFPRFVKEDISGRNLAIKFLAIIIMSVGVYMVAH